MQGSSSRYVTVIVDRQAQAERGRRGGLATAARHDSRLTTRAAREAFNARFVSDAERRAYFAAIGRLGAQARQQREASRGA